MHFIHFLKTLFKPILQYSPYILLCIFLLFGVVGCQYSLLDLSVLCSIFAYWYIFMALGMLLYYYYNHKKYRGFADKRAISVQYSLPREKSLLQTCFILNYDIDYQSLSAAILELVHLGYIGLTQKAPTYAPILHRKRDDISYLTNDQVYIMNSLLFHETNVYNLYLSRDKKRQELKRSLRDLEKILKKWALDEKYTTGDINHIRGNFAHKTRLLLFIFILPNFFILGPKIVFSFLLLTLVMFIFIIVFASFTKNIIDILYFTILFFTLLILGTKQVFLNMNVFDPLFYPMYAWQFTAFLGIYVMWSLESFGQKGAYLKKHILGYDLFRKVVKKYNQKGSNEKEFFALHYNVNTMNVDALSSYINNIVTSQKTPKKMVIIA